MSVIQEKHSHFIIIAARSLAWFEKPLRPVFEVLSEISDKSKFKNKLE